MSGPTWVAVHDRPAYVYAATVVRWKDGDTVVVNVDLGFRSSVQQTLRLRGIDCPEKRTPAGPSATAFSVLAAPPGSSVVIRTYSDTPETWGRYVADVYAGGVDIARALYESGNAVLMDV